MHNFQTIKDFNLISFLIELCTKDVKKNLRKTIRAKFHQEEG